MSHPVIICAPVRNELHNLSRVLPAWQLYADHIVVADQNSHDGTREFLAAHPKVTIVSNEDKDYSEPNRIPLMLAAARRISGQSILLCLDADETLSANVLTSLEWASFRNARPGTTGFFKWIQLWRSIKQYVAHGNVGKPGQMPYAFVDDGRPFDPAGVMHGPRGPGMDRPTRTFYFNDVVNLHFNLVNPDVYRKKQNWYKLFWRRQGGKYFYANRNHMLYDHIGPEHCDPSPPVWYEGFEQKGIDLVSVESPVLTWYDVEILQYMHRHGPRSLWLLDIWNQDWEHLRQLALTAGHPNIPSEPIRPPSRLANGYTNWTLGRMSVRRIARSGGRFFKRKLLP
jgi:Glycosyl transferase family 2